MKLTWFGGTTIRIHIGGRILVADPAGIDGVDEAELVSGADVTFGLAEAGPEVDPALWQPRRPGSMLDGAELPEVLVHGVRGGALVAAAGESPLLLLNGGVPKAGRWGRDAVVVVFGEGVAELAIAVLDRIGPRLIALAAPEHVVEQAVGALRDRLGDTALVSLEPGLALEV